MRFSPQGTETVDADGCCKVCIPRGHPCSLSSSMTVLESQGCKSKRPVNMTSCRGACGTFAFFSARLGSLQRSCSCCQEASTSKRTVELVCPDRSRIVFTYTHIEACECLKAKCSKPVGPFDEPHIPKGAR
uniref:CTCK domain-containing protein n=1 Tax=Neogobius melanostomus TaxID=47308 RepID=A0A8C6WH26_9GOBI